MKWHLLCNNYLQLKKSYGHVINNQWRNVNNYCELTKNTQIPPITRVFPLTTRG